MKRQIITCAALYCESGTCHHLSFGAADKADAGVHGTATAHNVRGVGRRAGLESFYELGIGQVPLKIVENARRRTKPLPDAQLLILCNIFPSNFDRFPLNIRKKEPHFAFLASFCFISCKVAFILTKGVDRCLSACYTYAYVILYIIYYFGAAGGNRDRRASSRQETG